MVAVARRVLDWTWYPTLLAIAFVLEPYAHVDVPTSAGWRILFIAVGTGIVLTLLGRVALGRDRGAAAAGLAVMGLGMATSLDRILLVLAAIAIVAIEGILRARGRFKLAVPWRRVSSALNVLLAVLVVLELGRIVQFQASLPTVTVPAVWTAIDSTDRPDIYLVLLDGHGRSDVLARDFDLDTTDWGDTLSSLSFMESTASQANHVHTRFSLSVLFNGRPLAELGQQMDAPVDESVPIAALRHSSAAELLDHAGYQFTVVTSGYEHLSLRANGPYIDVGPRNELEQAMIDGTAFGQAIDGLTAGKVHAAYERIGREVDALIDLASTPGTMPRFTFVHIPAPHWPLVLQSDCSFRPVDQDTFGSPGRDYRAGDAEAIAAQRDQTICVDGMIEPALRHVVTADPNAIVILLSDHGTEELLDWTNPAEPGLGDRFANLFWARTPGQPALFPDDVTLVNVLPILFNAYLGTQLPLHPNDLWFGPTVGVDAFSRYVPPAP